jgi:solute:Na+ symporter, SSS family
MDMPLFIIAVVYGLLWKRANWQGAIGGYFAGAIAGIIGQYFKFDFNITTFVSAGVALVVTPIISLITKKSSSEKVDNIWKAKKTSEEESKNQNVYNIIPKTTAGKISLSIFGLGFILFMVGIFLGSQGLEIASVLSVSGMILYFIGGLLKAYTN